MKELDVAIVGDIAWNQDITPLGNRISPGGAAYYSAVGASCFSDKVGVVARVGSDFNTTLLTDKGINVEGVHKVKDGKTCRFVITQYDNGREFSADRGIAAIVDTTILPKSYLSAKFIHLPTQLPEHALLWLDVFRCRNNVSVDTFEQFVKDYPELSREMCHRASLIFINEEELQTLHQLGELLSQAPIILKKGSLGASYIDQSESISVPAPSVIPVETTGAGDILAGAFLAQRAKGISIETSLVFAVHLASRSVTDFGVEHLITEK